MKTIKHQLSIGKLNSGTDLFATIKRDNQPLFKMKCDSFLASFMRAVYLNFGNGGIDDYFDGDRRRTVAEIEGLVRIENNGEDVRIGRTSGSWWIGSGNCAIIEGIRGFTVSGLEHLGITSLNGLWKTQDLDPEAPFEVINESGRAILIKGIGQYVSGEWENDSGAIITGDITHVRHNNNTNGTAPKRWRPIIGHSNSPVTPHDLCLYNRWQAGCLEGTTSVSDQITDQQSSKFALSRPFTNDLGQQVSIREIGIMSHYGNEFHLLARDVLGSAVQLSNGSTLSIDYEVVSNIQNFTQNTDVDGTNGGWTRRFITLMRYLATTDTNAQRYGAMAVGGNGAGITNDQYQRNSNTYGWLYGVRLGTNNKFVSMTDETLNPDDPSDIGIINGFGDGQLLHSGTHFGEFKVDDVSASFTVERYFENHGTSPITIREIGLFGSNSLTLTMSPALFARKALHSNDQFTIQPGQTVKVGFLCKAYI